MNKLLLYILLISAPTILKAQRSYETNPDRKRSFNWMFGDSIWLDFKTNKPTSKTGSHLQALESSCVYSDTAGGLLLYSDGVNLWNNQHKRIASDLDGHSSSSMGSVFVKHPGNDSIVYLFTTDKQCGSKGLRYSIIALSNNPDSVKILQKNIPLITSVCESIGVVQHTNENHTWVIVHSAVGNLFYAYCLTDSGITTCPVISASGYSFDGHFFNCQSEFAISPLKNKLGITLFNDDKILIFDFNASTGSIRNSVQFNDIFLPTGIAFSRNGLYFYMKERDRYLLQYNINANKALPIDTSYANEHIIDIRPTPHGSIIFNVLDSFRMSAIAQPDSNGLKAKYVHSWFQNNERATNGLPNFNESYFYTPAIDFAYRYDCLTNTLAFEGRDTFGAAGHAWRAIKKYGSSVALVSTIKRPLIAFPDTGIYNVRYIASKGIKSDTVYKQITIYPKINKDFLGTDSVYCKQNPQPVTFRTPPGMHCVRWQDGSSAESFTADTAGRYSVTITNQAFCALSDTIYLSEADAPPKPLIVKKHDTLFATGAGTFQWFYNGNPIGQNKHFLKISQDGRYKVKLSAGACDSTSDEDLYFTSIEPISFNTIRIYPNPADNILHVSMQDSQEPVRMQIYSITGVLLSDHILSASTTLQIESYPAGAYIITLTDLQFNTKTFKLIKQ